MTYEIKEIKRGDWRLIVTEGDMVSERAFRTRRDALAYIQQKIHRTPVRA